MIRANIKTSTSSATQKVLLAIPLADARVMRVEAWISCRRSTGAQRGYWHLSGLFYREGGNVTQQGATVALVSISSSTQTATLAPTVGTQSADLKVTGIASQTYNWVGWCEYEVVV